MGIPAILQQLAQSSPAMSSIKQMFGMVTASQNPQAMMNQLLTSNPNMKPVMDLIQQSGGDPKKAFYTLAEQKGIDPQEVLNMLK